VNNFPTTERVQKPVKLAKKGRKSCLWGKGTKKCKNYFISINLCNTLLIILLNLDKMKAIFLALQKQRKTSMGLE
jgi:hypothetical protein